MSIQYLDHHPVITPIIEGLKQREEERHQANKDIVRELLIKHDAEDLIPMLLED
jgi:hypothetical protein